MRIKFQSIKFFWSDCTTAFVYYKSIPLFSTGGGSYQDFSCHQIDHCKKHFYIHKWCFCTIEYKRIRGIEDIKPRTKLEQVLDRL